MASWSVAPSSTVVPAAGGGGAQPASDRITNTVPRMTQTVPSAKSQRGVSFIMVAPKNPVQAFYVRLVPF